MLGLQNEREWHSFCEKVLLEPSIGHEERFSANFTRVANREALRALIVQTFADLTFEEVIRRLDDAQIANAQVNDMAGVWAHPQLAARKRWRQVSTPSGMIPSLLPPGSSNAFEPRMDSVPALGEHTTKILSELNLTPNQLQKLQVDASAK